MGNPDIHETQALCEGCRSGIAIWYKNMLYNNKFRHKTFICEICEMRLEYLAYEREKSLAFQTTRIYHGKS